MMIVDGSVTLASSPIFSSKKMAAIGETYSWENRKSVRTNPLSAGCTHGTPNLPAAASTTQCEAKIFSAMVIGRGVHPSARVKTEVGSLFGADVATACWLAFAT